MMQYKGYKAKIEFDADSRLLYGRVLGIHDVVDFQGRDGKEIERAFRESVDDYLAFCAERGESPDKPYSGKFLFRTDAETHRHIAEAAELAGLSVNEWLQRAAEASLPRP